MTHIVKKECKKPRKKACQASVSSSVWTFASGSSLFLTGPLCKYALLDAVSCQELTPMTFKKSDKRKVKRGYF